MVPLSLGATSSSPAGDMRYINSPVPGLAVSFNGGDGVDSRPLLCDLKDWPS